MDLSPYVESLRRDLLTAAEAGGPEAAAAAERLGLALEPAVHLALFEALSQAAAEITQALPTGAVEVRLRGREPQFVVDVAPPVEAPPLDDAEEEALGDATARISLRLPEGLKTRVDEAANAEGLSVNGWVIRALRAATRRLDAPPDRDLDLTAIWMSGRRGGPGRRITGWAR